MENLIKIQTEVTANKSQTNKFGGYKYRSCEDICEAIRPLMKKYNCSFFMSDTLQMVGEKMTLTATVTFADPKNQFTLSNSSTVVVDSHKGMSTEQSCGAASSYARKYALAGLLMLDDNQDPDATNTHGKEETKTKAAPKKQTAEVNTKDFVEMINKFTAIEQLTEFKQNYASYCGIAEIRNALIAKYNFLNSK